MTGIIDYTVVSASVKTPRAEMEMVGGSTQTNILGPPQLEIVLQIPLDEAHRLDLPNAYAAGERIEFNGHRFALRGCGWHDLNLDEPYFEFTLCGSVPPEKLASFQKVLARHVPGAFQVTRTAEEEVAEAVGAAAERWAEERRTAVKANRSLGTLDDLT